MLATLALLSTRSIADSAALLFTVLQLLGGAYLIWMAAALLRTLGPTPSIPANGPRGLAASWAAGFLLTFGDIKALAFYASFFPAIVDLHSATVTELSVVALVTALTVGSAKTFYVLNAAALQARMTASGLNRWLRRITGLVLLICGALLLANVVASR